MGDASILAWPVQDVMAVQVKAPVQVNLRMLRADSKYFGGQLENMVRDHVVTVQTRNHTAASRLEVRGECIVLTQEFREGDYYCKSAVAIGKGKGRILNETEVRLEVQPGTVLIASAATFDPKEDVAASALRQLEAAAAKGWAGLSRETGDWWHEFWSRGWVSLRSADGVAQRVAQNYHYFLYLMASTSRGKFPPKFNGMLWNTGGDLRTWGAQHWYANTSCYYEAIFASNRMELLDPFFDMYSGMFDASATAARQQWGSQGIYIGETSYFNGLEKLPDDIAAEMQELYLLRKPWEQRSERFKEFALNKHPHSSRWNWMQAGEWKNGRYVDHGARLRTVWRGQSYFRQHGEDRLLLLAALRIHPGCGLAAHARLPDAERRGRVLSQLSQREEGRRREISHPQRQQQREHLRRARHG